MEWFNDLVFTVVRGQLVWWEVVWFGDSLFLGRRSIMIQNRKLDISEFRWAYLSRLDNKIVIWDQSHTTRGIL